MRGFSEVADNVQVLLMQLCHTSPEEYAFRTFVVKSFYIRFGQ